MNYEERLNKAAYSAGICFDYKKVFGYSLFGRIKIKGSVRRIVRRILATNNGRLVVLGGRKISIIGSGEWIILELSL